MDCMRAFACIKSVCFLSHKNSNYCSKCSSAESFVGEQLCRYDVKQRREGGERQKKWQEAFRWSSFCNARLDACDLVGAIRGGIKNSRNNGGSIDCVVMPSATRTWSQQASPRVWNLVVGADSLLGSVSTCSTIALRASCVRVPAHGPFPIPCPPLSLQLRFLSNYCPI